MDFLSKVQNFIFSMKIFKKCRPTILHSYNLPIIIYSYYDIYLIIKWLCAFAIPLYAVVDCRTV